MLSIRKHILSAIFDVVLEREKGKHHFPGCCVFFPFTPIAIQYPKKTPNKQKARNMEIPFLEKEKKKKPYQILGRILL